MGGVFYIVRSFDDWVNMLGKFRSMALCVLVLLLAYPATALALVGPVDVESSGWNEEPYIAYTMAPDQFTAACNFCNVDTDMLNTAQRAYLSSSHDWLAFQSACTENNDFSIALLAFPFYAKGPDESLYEVNVDGSVKGHAYSVLMDVIKGTVGPPNDNTSDATYWTLPIQVCSYNKFPASFTASTWTDSDTGDLYSISSLNTQYPLVPESGTLRFRRQMLGTEQLNAVMQDNWVVTVAVAASGSTAKDGYMIVAPENSVSIHYVSNAPTGTATAYIRVNADTYYSASFSTTLHTQSEYLLQSEAASARWYTNTAQQRYDINPYLLYAASTVDIPTDPDPTPQPPVQPPDPGTDVPTVDPPTWPTIDFPDITIHGAPITITWPTIADNADYTQLLKEIIKRLEKIGDVCADIYNELDEHCEHLQQAIKDAAEYIVDNLELGIDPDLDDLVRGIDNAWRKITQTIKEQVKWLADQLDYDFTVTLDLDKIEQYLRRIISKMGGGTSKPDPKTDPFDWGDWLDDIWRKIFTALQIALPDELGQLLELFDILKTKFPFSVPWDLIAIVALFDHEPVAPVLMLPYPTLTLDASGLSGGYLTFEVDCSEWDSAMTMVRDIELLLFTAYLISQTHWALDAIKPPAKG